MARLATLALTTLLAFSAPAIAEEASSFAIEYDFVVEGVSTYPTTGFVRLFRQKACGQVAIRRDYHVVEDKGALKAKFTGIVLDSVADGRRTKVQEVIYSRQLAPKTER